MPTADDRAVTRRDWNALYAALSEADARSGLPPEDLERLAVAAFLLGFDDEVTALRERAYHLYLDRGEREQAIRCGFWLSFHLQNRGEVAQASGWLAHLRRLVDDGPDGRYSGIVMMPAAVALMWSGDAAGALPVFERTAQVASDWDDVDIFALSGIGAGSCLQMLGRWQEAGSTLDEVMHHVAAGRVAPQVTGLAYCSVIALCMEQFDMRRAQEWTVALSSWIDDQTGVVPYRGVCLVHRAEILQLRGSWSQAAQEADRARTSLVRSGESAIGAAHYRVGELARLRGSFDIAERAYGRAAASGFEVQPGLARLRLAQHREEAAAAGLDRALSESPAAFPSRAPVLAARIDVALAAEDLGTAHAALDELCTLVEPTGSAYLRSMAEQCAGAVLLADGDAPGALQRLRRARSLWQELDAPYEAALTQLGIAQACAELGDDDAARMERDAARVVLRHLGATTDLAALDGPAEPPHHPLTAREVEVLRWIATGATNRAIAEQLVLSEKTVARHVSNIFTKLGITSRSSATAYAYEHRLT